MKEITTMFKTKCLLIFWGCSVFAISLFVKSAKAQTGDKLYSYLDNLPHLGDARVNGNARILKADGRIGIHTTLIGSTIQLPKHNLNSEKGAVSIWVNPLEDVFPSTQTSKMVKHDKYIAGLPFLSDNKVPNDYIGSTFFFGWDNAWHGGVRAKFFEGFQYEGAFVSLDYHKLLVWSNEFTLKAHKWYQFTLTWDNTTMNHAIYANGILIARENQFRTQPLRKFDVADMLFAGNPRLCVSDIEFYNKTFSAEEVYQKFRKEVTSYDAAL